MKNILLLLTFLVSFSSFTQTYPRIEKDSTGRKFVIMTYEQAQKVDNAFELLTLLEKAGAECDSLSLSYVKVISKLETQVILLESNITLLKNQIIDKDNQIGNLQQRLNNCESNVELCDEQIEVRDKQIGLLKEEISTIKTKRNIAYGVGVGGVILGILVIILAH